MAAVGPRQAKRAKVGGSREGRLAGRVAIITGGGSGIGRAAVALFAREDAHVVVADIDAASGRRAAEAARAAGGEATFCRCDVSVELDVKELVATAVDLHGRLDVLVNVAGVNIMAPLMETDLARWDRTLQVNLTSQFLMAREAMPHLAASGHGSIVNCSSIQASRGFANFPGYASAKAGILGLTRQLAVDHAAKGVRVNAVSPGPVLTNLMPNSAWLERDFPPVGEVGLLGDAGSGVPDQVASEAEDLVASQACADASRLFKTARAEDVAQAMLFLASPEAAAITGVDLPLDGGFSVKGLSGLELGQDPARCCVMATPAVASAGAPPEQSAAA